MQVSTGLVQDRARAFGDKIAVDGVDEKRIASVFGFDWKAGSDSSYAKLASGGAIVTDEFAKDHHLSVGDRFQVTAIKGDRLGLSVAGISKPDKFNPLGTGEVTIARSAYDRAFTAERERYAFVAADGASRPALEKALAPFAGREAPVEERVRDRPVRLGGPDPRDLLRPPRPGRDRVAVRHREHAGAVGAGAHA